LEEYGTNLTKLAEEVCNFLLYFNRISTICGFKDEGVFGMIL
jgi:hypothetical protein